MIKKQVFSKFIRPEAPRAGRISERDLDILETILRYRFSPTSELLRLVGGNEDVSFRRLRRLWELGLINRWAFPGIRSHSEFYYYLDNRQALDVLFEFGRLNEIHPQMIEEVAGHRDKDYAGAVLRGQHMQLGFLQHSLMISRLHFMLEMACRRSAGAIQLASWSQGSELTGRKVELPKIVSSRSGGGYFWQEHDVKTEHLPVEPDALFTLRFADRLEQPAHFFYEADRGTMTTTDIMKKLRAYYHFIKRQQKHKETFGVHPIRAVLVETPDEGRAKKLMQLVNHPLVIGPRTYECTSCGDEFSVVPQEHAGKWVVTCPSCKARHIPKQLGLFWFSISTLFTGRSADAEPRPTTPYLQKPELVLDRIWATPDRSLHALADAENAAVVASSAP